MKREQDVQAEKQIPVTKVYAEDSSTGSGYANNTGHGFFWSITQYVRGYGNGYAVGNGSVTDCNYGRGWGREQGFWDCSGGFPA